MYQERNLPHCYPPAAVLFVTWCLYGARPHLAVPDEHDQNAGRLFAQSDRLMDRSISGSLWLRDPRIAEIVAATIDDGERKFRLYERCAWVIMPNHVHLVMSPYRPLPQVMRWIKGSSARYANSALGRTGSPFWQGESYDHVVRNTDELNRVIRYVERNPVSSGLATSIEAWPWSSANSGRKA